MTLVLDNFLYCCPACLSDIRSIRYLYHLILNTILFYNNRRSSCDKKSKLTYPHEAAYCDVTKTKTLGYRVRPR